MTEIGTFGASIYDLNPNTTYHFRAKAVGDGTAYGDDLTFTTEVRPCGDADGDCEITMNDGRQIFMNLIYGPDDYPLCDAWAADCDGIEGITMNDGRQIFMYLIYGADKYPLVCR